jgi:(2S)-methylsuccinyl-CoA dehydrogenase
MPQTAPLHVSGQKLVVMARAAVDAGEAMLSDATIKVRERLVGEGRLAARVLDREQRATHGLAWLATYVEALRQLAAYAERMHVGGRLSEIEELLAYIGLGEYLAQIQGGIPISQVEIVRPADLGLSAAAVSARMTPIVEALIASGNAVQNRSRLVELLCSADGATFGDPGLNDTL